MSAPAPTERQYAYLRSLAGASALVCGQKRETEMYLRRGWVTARHEPDAKHYPYSWVRITPEGLRALAVAVEKYGLPSIGPVAVTEHRVCADCGSSRYRFEHVEHEVPA